MNHIVLLGDSIFDNAAYVDGGPDVLRHLTAMLPKDWKATLLAVDGSVTTDVVTQASRIPKSATHLVVSVGGNDGLARLDILEKPTQSVGTALGELAALRSEFQQNYSRMLKVLVASKKPVALCTVYNPNFADALMQRLTTTALTLFNDCIIREAIIQGLPVLDLRLLCSGPADFANEIEPGVSGGKKIAGGILNLFQHHDFSRARTVLYS